MPSKNNTSYYRNFVFGVEDSLVSTVGLLAGIAVAGMENAAIVTTGLVLIFVEAISMAAGSFLSESSADSYEHHRDGATTRSYVDALIMFVSYIIAGLIPLLPYILLPETIAFASSIGLTLIALILLGVMNAEVSGTSLIRNVARMVLISGSALAAGLFVGRLF